MKKLMIALVAVAIATVTNAASVAWSATAAAVAMPTGSTATKYCAYFFDSALNATDLQKALEEGTWTGSDNLASVQNNVGALIFKNKLGSYESETVTFSMVLFDNDTIANATKYKYVETTLSFVKSNLTANFSDSLSSASWNTIAVPEPTSGLLMLLGMAGLALRRRRA